MAETIKQVLNESEKSLASNKKELDILRDEIEMAAQDYPPIVYRSMLHYESELEKRIDSKEKFLKHFRQLNHLCGGTALNPIAVVVKK